MVLSYLSLNEKRAEDRSRKKVVLSYCYVVLSVGLSSLRSGGVQFAQFGPELWVF